MEYPNNLVKEWFVFTDIDGVLSTSKQYFMKNLHPKYQCYKFDPECSKIYNDIVNVMNAHIVLTSDWREQFTIDEMNDIFHWSGINHTISDITISLMGATYFMEQELAICRAHEILEYVHRFKIKKFIVIDDLDLSPWLKNNFVQCPRYGEGIKQTGIKEKILNKFLSNDI
jgi:hypothetical protein